MNFIIFLTAYSFWKSLTFTAFTYFYFQEETDTIVFLQNLHFDCERFVFQYRNGLDQLIIKKIELIRSNFFSTFSVILFLHIIIPVLVYIQKNESFI